MTNLFCPATGFESDQDWVLESFTGQLTTVRWQSNTGHTHQSLTQLQPGTQPQKHLNRWRLVHLCCLLTLAQPRVCLGRKWIFEKQDRLLPALYWRLGSMLNLWHTSTARAFSLGLSPVCCRFIEFAYPAHPPVFALWTWPGPPT